VVVGGVRYDRRGGCGGGEGMHSGFKC